MCRGSTEKVGRAKEIEEREEKSCAAAGMGMKERKSFGRFGQRDESTTRRTESSEKTPRGHKRNCGFIIFID